ncbi:hypothetical protein Vi05172_g7671 [Venturia inaequalis]|uniref:Fungal N-terminal domain-containing protein n=1 Tax=Venturia inaequalis TaxID=5025 RepID=A0A8H3VNF6_VENIN|nr:hypothetical protein EG327_000817 [Venturia inaequalis]RDI82271.1 hypothetical protein Vi05172_g7671 [Venturia inaequalis]
MDPLSISAGVIAITTVSIKVAKGLYKLADGIGTAGQEVRVSADRVSNFSTLLMSLNHEISKPTKISPVEQVMVLDIVGVCSGLMQPLRNLQQALVPLLIRYRDSAEKLRQFGLRVKFYFSCKAKLLQYLDLVEKHMATINITLGVMNLKESRNKSHAIYNISHFHLQTNIEKADFIASQIGYGSRGLLAQKASSAHLIANGDETTESLVTGIEDREDDASENESAEQEAQGDSTALVPANAPAQTTTDGLTEPELVDMDQQVSQALDPDEGKQALEVWQDLNVIARKVIKHAKDILQTEDQHTMPEVSEPARAYQETSQSEGAHQDAAQPVAAQEEQVQPRAAYQEDVQLEKLQETGQIGQSSPLVEATPRPSIIYVNSAGDTYQIPYERVATWGGAFHTIQAMEKKPLQAGASSRRVNDNYRRSYYLTDEQGRVISPETWEDVVRPGDKITFHFNRRNRLRHVLVNLNWHFALR